MIGGLTGRVAQPPSSRTETSTSHLGIEASSRKADPKASSSFHCISTSFEARRAGLLERALAGLLLLRCGLLLLLPGRRVLPATLAARGDRAGRGTSPRITHDAADDRATRRAASACTGGCPRRRRRWLRRRLLRRRLCRIKAALLDSPGVALALVLLLLLRVWPFAG